MTPPQVFKGSSQVVNQIPLTPMSGSTTATKLYAIRSVGPIQLQPGDRVLVTAREQLDNPNRDAGDDWAEPILASSILHKEGRLTRDSTGDLRKVPGYWLENKWRSLNVDPRWTLWVGNQLGVIRTTSSSATTGTDVIRATGENWDNWVHHWRYSDSGWDVVVENVPAAYYVTTVWFETTPEYRLPGQSIQVTPRGSIEAAVFR